jgi:hypothetical protein
MSPSGDELAGIVDLFGGLTREELRQAVAEAAFRAGEEVDASRLAAAIDAAVDEYRLVACDPDAATTPETAETPDEDLLVAGPTAFPELPEAAEDLRIIMDVERRSVDRAAIADAVGRRFRAETSRAVETGDGESAATLLDVSYDVETWGPVDLSDARERLDETLATDENADAAPDSGSTAGDGGGESR